MGQARTVHGASPWYLIAREGDMVLRVRPGMPLGETAAGELSFDPSCAQLELDIADDGGLMLSAVDDHELESAGGMRCRSERLTRDRHAEIRLSHNVLQLVTDLVDPAAADETVEIHRRHRSLGPLIAALIGLGGLGLAALYPMYPALREGGVPGTSTTGGVDAVPQTAPAQAPSEVAENTGPDTDAYLSVVPSPSEPLLPPTLNTPQETKPESREETVVQLAEPLPEPGPAAAPATEPAAPPRVQRPSTPQVAKTTGDAPVAGSETTTPKVATTAGADAAVERPATTTPKVASSAAERRATTRSAPRATAAAKPKENGEKTTRTESVELARRRALFAADQALAQGRLTTPPQTNAYALYNRVLALDPGSAEANRGLQSVRQGLINRAMAQLASGALDDARVSLQAAADVGADGMLVAHLRDEVDYRQRLIDAPAE